MSDKPAVDPSLLDLFRAELEIHLPALSEGLLALEKDPRQPKRLEALMRAAHSIKGAARIVGVDTAVQVAHIMEDCFVAAQNSRITLTSDTVDVLLRGVDALQRNASPPDEECISAEALRQLVDDITAIRDGQPLARVAPSSSVEGPVVATLGEAGPPTIRPTANLAAAEVEAVRVQLMGLLRQRARLIRFDLAEVRDIDPPGLALLALAARTAIEQEPPTTFQLINAAPAVRNLLRLMRLDGAFPPVGGGS